MKAANISSIAAKVASVGRATPLRETTWDASAVVLLFLAPFAKFLAARDYGFLHVEILIALGMALSLAVLIAFLIALRPDSLRPACLCLPIVFYLLHATELPVPSALWADGGLILRSLFYLLPVVVLSWLMRRKLSRIFVAILGTMTLYAALLPHPPVKALTVAQTPETPASDQPPFIHLVLDQQIGIEGIQRVSADGRDMRRELSDFYQSAGFRVYGRAFTHFPATMESIPGLLNNSVEPQAHRWINLVDGRATLRQNLWFRQLRARGYTIDVVQTRYIDFCRDPEAPVVHCSTFDFSDIRVLGDLDVGSFGKARYLLLYFLDTDHEWLSRHLRFIWHGLQTVAARAGFKLSDWNARASSPSSVISLKALDQIAARLEKIGPGQALFAHLLLPHHPYVLDEACQVKRDLAHWAQRTSSLWWRSVPADPARLQWRRGEYFKQMRCLNQRLQGLFTILERRSLADDATVIIHGDHGSLITLLDPINRNYGMLSREDILSSYSTLFAIRTPGLTPILDDEFASIQGLFARHVMGLRNFVDHGDIFLKPDDGVIGPQQRRRPMVQSDINFQ